MRTLLFIFAAFLLSSCDNEAAQASLELDDGNVLKAQSWQGKWVYINYWAQWCKPCAEEIPELNAFAQANNDVLLLGVNFDKVNSATLLKQISAMRIEFPVVTNDIQQAFKHPMPQGLPTTIVINPEGKIVHTLSGPQTAASLTNAKSSPLHQ
jgi:thiol-disulfide isomerase/thioredoxin